jgi:DNA invertase Pin-like site-specific DNA recombinase
MSKQEQIDGYIRVSRVAGREGDSYISPTMQREAIQRWADYRDVKIAEWHTDEDWSGGTHDRPGLNSAITRALNGETGGIVSWKLDRFSRHTESALRDLQRLNDAGARLAFVVEDIDTASVYGKMVYTILLAVSEAFLEGIKLTWRTAKERSIARGAAPGPTSYGYQRDEQGRIVIDDDAAEVVRNVYTIATNDGVTAALDYMRENCGERVTTGWRPYHVRRLLSNRAYLGEQRYGDLINTHGHVAIVSREVFERANAAVETLPIAKKTRGNYPLTGLATCASCGGYLIGGNGETYTCRSVYPGHERCAEPAAIKARALERHLVELLIEDLSEDRPTVLAEQAGVGDLETLQLDLEAAEGERDRFAADPTAAELLGAQAWQNALRTRAERVAEARERYQESLATSKRARVSVPVERLAELTSAELAPVFRSVFADVIVSKRRAGLKLPDRVRIVQHDDGVSLAA